MTATHVVPGGRGSQDSPHVFPAQASHRLQMPSGVASAYRQSPAELQSVGIGPMRPMSHGSPQAFPAQGSTGSQVKVPAVTHSPLSLHAVAAKVGTGQFAGSVPGGQ